MAYSQQIEKALSPKDRRTQRRPSYIGNLQRLYEITWQLIVKDLKAKYKSSFLGYIWSIGTPLLTALILNFAFQRVIRIQIEHYGLFLISVLFSWQWFANVVNGGSWVFLANASILKKLSFPHYLLPLSITLIEAFHYLLALPVIGIFLYLHDYPLWHDSWLYGIPLLLLVQTVLCFGLALFVGSLNTLFRDMERMIGLLVSLLFYLTPILYPVNMIPAEFYSWMEYNPMLNLVEAWRQLIMEGKMLWPQFGNSVVHGLIALGAGAAVYRMLNRRFAEVL